MALLVSCGTTDPYDPTRELETLAAQLGAMSNYDIVKQDTALVLQEGNRLVSVLPNRQDSILILHWQVGEAFGYVHPYTSLYKRLPSGGYQPLFADTTVSGKYVQATDLNADGVPEYVLDRPMEDYEGNAATVGEFVMYTPTEESLYTAEEPLFTWEYDQRTQSGTQYQSTQRLVDGKYYLEFSGTPTRLNEDGTRWEGKISYYIYQWDRGQPAGAKLVYLVTEEADTRLYSNPVDGSLLKRLEAGAVLAYREKGPYEYRPEEAGGDYWYLVEYEGETGWVYGAQTNWWQWARYSLETHNDIVRLLVKQLDNPPSGLTDTRCGLGYVFLDTHVVITRNCPEEAGDAVNLWAFTLPNYTPADDITIAAAANGAEEGNWYTVNEFERTLTWNTAEDQKIATLSEEGEWSLEAK
ncbi:MAG TPA: hypothetical protein DCE41_26160 [Cytophagales bacterium]|nr:hypothetical protein [Cytophagales bacterium]